MNIQKKLLNLIENDPRLNSGYHFAQKAGLPNKTVNHILRGHYKTPQKRTLSKIADYFNCSAESLLDMEDGYSHSEALMYLSKITDKNLREIARRANIRENLLYKVSSGQTRMLSNSITQKICKSLKVDPEIFKRRM